jgi:hypothetical protein
LPDKKITALSAITTPVDADIMPIVVDISTTAVTKKITWANIKAALNSVYMALVAPGADGNVLTALSGAWTSSAPATGGVLSGPGGFMDNGVITVTVSGNNLKVAIKTIAGADPSAGSPVKVRIGNTYRSITAALSVTKNAGTNWCNAGSAELATQEIDYFVYFGYNATDGVVIGFSRIPWGRKYSEFSTTTTAETYCAISTITNAAADDEYVNIGRFGAILSAGAGYTWTVPIYTADNLVQRPIYETRSLVWKPTITNLTVGNGSIAGTYFLVSRMCYMGMNINFQSTSSIAGSLAIANLPFVPALGILTNSATITDAGVGTFSGSFSAMTINYKELAVRNSNATYSGFTPLSSTVPMTWAAGDSFNASEAPYRV